MKSYMPTDSSGVMKTSRTPTCLSNKLPTYSSYHTLGSLAGDAATGASNPPRASSPDSPDIGNCDGMDKNFVSSPSQLSSSNTLPRLGLRGPSQPLTALVDRVGSPGSISSAASHQYYTLKINCTRRHNESFV